MVFAFVEQHPDSHFFKSGNHANGIMISQHTVDWLLEMGAHRCEAFEHASRPTFGPAPPIMRGACFYSSDFPLRGALLRKLWPIVVEVLKADDKNDHDAADIICVECIPVLVSLHAQRAH